MNLRVAQLVAVIELILCYHEFGIRVITGDVEPTMQDIESILNTFNINSGSSVIIIDNLVSSFSLLSPQELSYIRAETIINIVYNAGGWAGIAKMAREFRKIYPITWDIFRTHVEWISGAGTRAEEDSALVKIADKFKISVHTVRRKRKFVVYKIAAAALKTDRVLLPDD